jgi:hypothetical protein
MQALSSIFKTFFLTIMRGLQEPLFYFAGFRRRRRRNGEEVRG